MATKYLVIQDVPDLGRSGDIVTARPGYARNYLLPKGLVVMADKNAIRMQERLQEQRKQRAIEEKKEAEVLAASIEGFTITAIVKVDHEGHMYGSVTIADVVHMMQDQHQKTIDRHAVQLKHPIKSTGVHTIGLKFNEGVTATISLKVMPEESEEALALNAAKKS